VAGPDAPEADVAPLEEAALAAAVSFDIASEFPPHDTRKGSARIKEVTMKRLMSAHVKIGRSAGRLDQAVYAVRDIGFLSAHIICGTHGLNASEVHCKAFRDNDSIFDCLSVFVR